MRRDGCNYLQSMGCKSQPNNQTRNSCSLQLHQATTEFMLIKQHPLGGLEKHLPPLNYWAGSAQTQPSDGEPFLPLQLSCCRARLVGCCEDWVTPGQPHKPALLTGKAPHTCAAKGTALHTCAAHGTALHTCTARAGSQSPGIPALPLCARPRQNRSVLLLHSLLSPPQQRSGGEL